MATTYRIFLSSPSDVEDERLAVQRVVDLINAGRTPDQQKFELFRWEEHFYTADSSFQDQVVQPADCDLVLCLFWKRLGSELPPNYQRPDGTTPTGSEFEFEQALSKATEAEPKTPDIFVYLKTAPVVFAEETMAIEVEQRQKLLSFWSRWFKSEQGHFTAAYQKFEEIDEFETLIERNLLSWLKQHEPDDDWHGGSPFPGLRAYDVIDGDIFFGRSRDVGRVRARLFANAASGPAVLFISGASGAGKSSVLRAGLIASLIRPGGFAPHADFVYHIITTPAALGAGKDWAVSLAEAMLANDAFGEALRQGDFDQATSLGAILAIGGEAAMAPLRKALERMKAAARDGADVAFALAIDQFEEVFQYAPEDIEAFGTLLGDMAAISVDGTRFVILGSMRSDHRHRFNEVASLALLSGRDQVRTPDAAERFFDLAPPRPADLREIITEPARVAGLSYAHDGSASLAAVIEAEATGEALPALQLLLFSLFEDRTDDELRFEAHFRFGGVGGVMATTAEAAFQAVSTDAQAAFPRVLRALVAESADGANGGGTTARWANANTLAAEGDAAELVEALKEAHLLRSEDQKLRVAHESLLSHWDRAADQIAADKRFFDIRARLGARAVRWKAATTGQASRMLLRDFDLEEGRALIAEWGEAQVAETAPEATGFIRASISAARRRSLTMLVAAAVVLMMITAGAFAAWMYRVDAAAAVKEADVRLEVGRANEALRLGEVDIALAASLAATDLADMLETRSILAMTVNEASPDLMKTLDTTATALAWRSDGALIGVGEGKSWLAEPGIWTTQVVAGEQNDEPVLALKASPDGWFGVRTDGTVATDAGARPLDAPALDLLRASQIAIRLDASGALAALADDSDRGVWTLRCPAQRTTMCVASRLSIPDATSVALLSVGDALIAAQRGGEGASITTFSSKDGAALGDKIVFPEVEEFMAVAISPRDGQIAAGARNGSVFLTKTAETSGDEIYSGSRPVMTLVWSASGDYLAANCNSRDVCVFTADGALQSQITGPGGAIIWIGFSPDDAHIATLDDKDVARVWSVAPNRAATSRFATSEIAAQRVSALAVESGKTAAAYDDGVIRVWSVPDAAPVMVAPIKGDRRGDIRSIALSANGALAAVDAEGGIALWLAPAAGQPPDVHLKGIRARRLAFLGDGRIVATTSDGGIALVELDGGVKRIEGAGPSPDGVATLGGGFIVSNTAAAFPMFDAGGTLAGSLSTDIVEATLSASSLSAHPDGRWLAASRDDGMIRLYSLDQPTVTIDLPILRQDSKFVAFSPDGAKLAALDVGDNLYVWTFDAVQGAASPYLQLPALPRRGGPLGVAREANGLGWTGLDCLAIASLHRGIFQICHDMKALKARAGQLLGR